MKKIIVLTAFIVMACLQTVVAQDREPGYAVLKSFNDQFGGAANVKWTHIRNIWQSRFFVNGEYCLAYYNLAGDLLIRGKKISYDLAPSAVRKGVEKIQNAAAQPELFSVSEIYELDDAGITEYYMNLDSDAHFMSLIMSRSGHSTILKKINKENSENRVAVVQK